MGAAQIRQRGAAGMIAILDVTAGFLRAASAQIDGEHGFDVGHAAPVDELVGAEIIWFGGQPGVIQPGRTLRDRSDTIFPVIAADKVAARIAHDRRRQLVHQGHHVLAEALGVGGGMAWFINAAIHTTPEMLDERTEQPPVGGTDREVGVEQNMTFARHLRVQIPNSPRQNRQKPRIAASVARVS
jgi:hypothetical protein